MPSLTRQDLYDLVWSEAGSRVAERFSLSGPGLRRICMRNDIPLPPRGYWAKVSAGKQTQRSPLPRPRDASDLVQIREGAGYSHVKHQRSLDDVPLVTQRKAFEADPRNRIEVREQSKQSHPWAREVKRRLKEAKPNYRGLLEARAIDHLVTVEVSENVIGRVVGIIDAIGRAVEKRRLEVVGTYNADYGYARYREAFLVVGGVQLRFRLVERSRRKEKPRSARARSTPIWERDHEYDYEPTGLLRLTVIGKDPWRYRTERVVADKTKQPGLTPASWST